MTGIEELNPDVQPPSARAGGFQSVLFPDGSETTNASEPAFFADLNLDQVIEAIVAGRDDYGLRPFFWTPLPDAETVVFRQEVSRDLEDEQISASVRAFAEQMQRVRSYMTLARKQYQAPERRRWFLDGADMYRRTVLTLAAALQGLELASAGMQSVRDYLDEHTHSPLFQELAADVDSVLGALAEVRYTLRLKEARVTVSEYHDEAEYSSDVERVFARFRERDAESHLINVSDPGSMDYVEAQIADLVARLHPEPFRLLDVFCAEHADFIDARVARFDREAQFYLAYLEHSRRLTRTGLVFCYPTVSQTSKTASAEASFDIALAGKLVPDGAQVVTNDFALADEERIIVVTGPNQGGKTTFARTFGQLHYLAALGLPVPGRTAELHLPDRLFTHFEREENIETLRGKLDDELIRMRDIFAQATGDSVIVINEIFTSTTLVDAVELGERVLNRIIALDCLAVCVTFVDELTTLAEATVSMVATVDPDDPSQRTFKVVRRAADGRAYASALADKYGLSYDRLKDRLA